MTPLWSETVEKGQTLGVAPSFGRIPGCLSVESAQNTRGRKKTRHPGSGGQKMNSSK